MHLDRIGMLKATEASFSLPILSRQSMRRAATPPPLQQLSAAVATAETSAAMSSRPPYRGGRGERRGGFSSERPYSGGRGQFVSGDSHYQSVRESNLGLWQGDRGSFTNNAGSYTAPPNPRPPYFSGYYQFRQASPHIQWHQYRGPHPHTHNQQPSSFNQNQGVRTPQQLRPRPPKPPDYRHWDYAKTPHPSTCERFTVLSYNILADYLAMDHKQKLYHHIPHYMLDWEWRKNNILFELGLWSTDIMCFQEVDRFHELEEALKVRGFNGIWKMRTGIPVDGCAIFWRVSRFNLLHEECIEFNKLGLRDNVAQICVLEQRSQDNANNSDAPPSSTSNLNKVVICNIHVLYNPKRGEIKLGQVRILLEKAHAISKIWNDAPIVLCGDFNCTPKSALYNFISEQKLELSDVDRDKVSGQSSAEIHQPSSLFRNPRPQTANGSVPLQLRSDSRDIERKPDSSLSDMKNQDCPHGRINENLPSVNQSLLPDSSDSVLSVYNNSCNDLQLGMKGISLHFEGQKESKNVALFDHKNVGETTFCVSVDSFNDSSITCAEDESDRISEKVSELVSPFGTDSEELHLNATERRQMEKVDSTSHLYHRSSTDGLDRDVNFDKESKNCVNNIILDDGQTDLLASKNVPLTPAFQNFMADTAVDSSEVVNFVHPIAEFKKADTAVDSSEVVNFVHPIAEFKKESSARNIRGGPSMSTPRIDLAAVDERLKILSSDEQDVATLDGSLTEDDRTFLSALHDVEETFSSEIHQSVRHQSLVAPHTGVGDDLVPELNAESFEVENIIHDRSLWTPMEIEIATGNADCTLMEHPLKLRSTYTEIEDFSGTRDENQEPLVTSYNRCFLGTVDYIWRSEGLQTVKVLAPIKKEVMRKLTSGFPTKMLMELSSPVSTDHGKGQILHPMPMPELALKRLKWGSDHIALATELAFIRRHEE